VFFLKFGVEVGVEESIVNDPLVLKNTDFSNWTVKNTNNAKSEVRFKQLMSHKPLISISTETVHEKTPIFCA
jgi:hypothetical protein